MKKTLAGLGVAAALSCAMAFTAFAGWGQDETGYYYQFDSGAYARDQIVDIEGTRYAFNPQGYMVNGWFKNNTDWYFCAPEQGGAIITGWRQVDGLWYYLNPGRQGAMHTSWLDEGGKRYYLNESGAMVTGSFSVDNAVYFAEASGELRRSTRIEENGITIRYDENGKEWYKNTENVVNHQDGGELWLPLLPGEDLARQRAVVQIDNEYVIQDQKELLYAEYKENVVKGTTYNVREKRRVKWEAKVKKTLEKYYVSAEEIAEYINDVIHNRYNPKDFYNTDDGTEEDDDYYDDYYDED